MTSKFSTTSIMTESDFAGLEVSDRTTSVNYEDIRKSSIALLGKQNSVGLAIKLNLRGMKVKPDDYFKIAGNTVMVTDLVNKIHQQEGYGTAAATNKSLGKDSKKTLVSLSRIARAFAPETIHAIEKNHISVEKELVEIAKSAGLNPKYAFLAAPWGMNDATLRANSEALYNFAFGFDNLIATAHNNGWCVGHSVRSHADTFVNYTKFRGVDLG